MSVDVDSLIALTIEKKIPLEKMISFLENAVTEKYRELPEAFPQGRAVLNRDNGEMTIQCPQYDAEGKYLGGSGAKVKAILFNNSITSSSFIKTLLILLILFEDLLNLSLMKLICTISILLSLIEFCLLTVMLYGMQLQLLSIVQTCRIHQQHLQEKTSRCILSSLYLFGSCCLVHLS